MRRVKAFTLIELLVVIAIIALLVSILVPSLTRARDMAKRAVCSSSISNHGKSIAMYVALYGTYPLLAPAPASRNGSFMVLNSPSGLDTAYGWPTMYAVLEMNNLKGSHKTNWGNWYYGGPVEQIWDGCVCPAMDAPAVWAAQDNAGSLGYDPLWWMSFHKWAVGYQFSAFQRSPVPLGRYPNKPGPAATEDGLFLYWSWCYQWIMGRVNLLNGQGYYLQAINDEELGQPGEVFQASDGWDMESTPGVDWTVSQRRGFITPGWHAGPPLFGARLGFNGQRHQSSPNILYGDGHVSADATEPMPADDLRDDLIGAQILTYKEYKRVLWGNLDRAIPVAELLE